MEHHLRPKLLEHLSHQRFVAHIANDMRHIAAVINTAQLHLKLVHPALGVIKHHEALNRELATRNRERRPNRATSTRDENALACNSPARSLRARRNRWPREEPIPIVVRSCHV